MEPDDIPVHDLLGVGDETPPGPDELRAIVARAGRRRLRVAAAGMAVALAVGGLVGYAVSNHSPGTTQTAAGAGGTSTTNAAAASGPNAALAPTTGAATLEPAMPARPYTHLFTRTAGPVTIRGYLTNFSLPVGLPAGCGFGVPLFQAEVSTAQIVGTEPAFASPQASQSLSAVQSTLVGTQEGDPVAVLIAHTGSSVTEVRMTFAGGTTDQMAPVQGWVALAAPAASGQQYGLALGTLTALTASGHAVSSTAVTLGQQAGPQAMCMQPCSPKVQPRTAQQTLPFNTAQSSVGCGVCNPPTAVPGNFHPEGAATATPTTVVSGGPAPGAAAGSAASACVTTVPPAASGGPPIGSSGTAGSGGATTGGVSGSGSGSSGTASSSSGSAVVPPAAG